MSPDRITCLEKVYMGASGLSSRQKIELHNFLHRAKLQFEIFKWCFAKRNITTCFIKNSLVYCILVVRVVHQVHFSVSSRGFSISLTQTHTNRLFEQCKEYHCKIIDLFCELKKFWSKRENVIRCKFDWSGISISNTVGFGMIYLRKRSFHSQHLSMVPL